MDIMNKNSSFHIVFNNSGRLYLQIYTSTRKTIQVSKNIIGILVPDSQIQRVNYSIHNNEVNNYLKCIKQLKNISYFYAF